MQADFFEPQPPASLPEQPARRRVFLYDGQVFEDPGPHYSNQDILHFLAQTYPELGHATWSARTLPDGTEEITFVKITGEKGSTTSVSPRQVTACLHRLTPTRLEALELLDQITALETDPAAKLGAAHLLAISPVIEIALQQAERIAADSHRIVNQCLQLTPIPLPKVPLGF